MVKINYHALFSNNLIIFANGLGLGFVKIFNFTFKQCKIVNID